MTDQNSQTSSSKYGCLSFFIRALWFMAGNVAIIFSLLYIAFKNPTHSIIPDVVFWIAFPVTIIARYIDIKYFNGMTAEGAPATMNHFKRFALILAACSLVGWVAAHAIARYVM